MAIRDDSVLLLFNAHHESLAFTMPVEPFGANWRTIIDTATVAEPATDALAAGTPLEVAARSIVVLSRASTPTSGG